MGCAESCTRIGDTAPVCRVQPEKPFLAVTTLPFSKAEGPTTVAPHPLASLHPQRNLAVSSVIMASPYLQASAAALWGQLLISA